MCKLVILLSINSKIIMVKFRCPGCDSSLSVKGEIECDSCGNNFNSVKGTPVLLPSKNSVFSYEKVVRWMGEESDGGEESLIKKLATGRFSEVGFQADTNRFSIG